MQISNRNKRTPGRAAFAGVTGADCRVVPGGLAKNEAHFEKLLLAAGLKQTEIEALCDKNRVGKGVFRAALLRAELHQRGILPLTGRPYDAATAAASQDGESPPELAQAVSALARRIDSLSPVLAARAATGPAAIAALRLELRSLFGLMDKASLARKTTICAELRTLRNA
jgi:hypothetical protein